MNPIAGISKLGLVWILAFNDQSDQYWKVESKRNLTRGRENGDIEKFIQRLYDGRGYDEFEEYDDVTRLV